MGVGVVSDDDISDDEEGIFSVNIIQLKRKARNKDVS